jgi:Cysteine-rich CPXCG
MLELIPASFRCAYCGEENETVVDPSAGPSQSYTEDCQVCCRPNVIRVTILGEGDLSLSAEPEE